MGVFWSQTVWAVTQIGYQESSYCHLSTERDGKTTAAENSLYISPKAQKAALHSHFTLNDLEAK